MSLISFTNLFYFILFCSISYLSEIIGKSGANIRAIQEFTGVKLAIPQVSKKQSRVFIYE